MLAFCRRKGGYWYNLFPEIFPKWMRTITTAAIGTPVWLKHCFRYILCCSNSQKVPWPNLTPGNCCSNLQLNVIGSLPERNAYLSWTTNLKVEHIGVCSCEIPESRIRLAGSYLKKIILKMEIENTKFNWICICIQSVKFKTVIPKGIMNSQVLCGSYSSSCLWSHSQCFYS